MSPHSPPRGSLFPFARWLVIALFASGCGAESAPSAPESGGAAPAGASPAAAATEDRAAAKVIATYRMGDRTVEVTRKFYDDLYAKLELYYNVFILTEEMTDENFWLHLLRLEEATESGILATDKDVRAHLTYLLGGTFDDKRYQEILDYHKIPRAGFEDAIRGVMMGEKLIDYYRDTSRSLDSDVVKRYQSRETTLSISFVPFVYSDYLEGPELPLPERGEEEVDRRLAEIQGEIEELSVGLGPQSSANKRVLELREELAGVEMEKQMIDAVKAREEAAYKAAKSDAEELKKAVMDATSEAHKDVMDAVMAGLPERSAAEEKDFRAKLPEGQEFSEQLRKAIETKATQELRLEAMHAIKPYYARHFDELTKARNLRVLDIPSYRVDWAELSSRRERKRKLGQVPSQSDFERFFALNTTIPRMLEGQLGGVFPDEVARSHYLVVMRKVTVPEAKTIDALSYRTHRKYGEMIRRNQMEALFSFAPIVSRHRLQLLEAPRGLKEPELRSTAPPGAGATNPRTSEVGK